MGFLLLVGFPARARADNPPTNPPTPPPRAAGGERDAEEARAAAPLHTVTYRYIAEEARAAAVAADA